MKRVAIITLVGCFNYGNRLQNYSLQKFLTKEFNCDVKTIRRPNFTRNIKLKKSFYRFIEFNLIYNTRLKRLRYKKIKEFDQKIKYDEIFYNINDISYINDKYDYFIVGSDQIWNWVSENRSAVLPYIDKAKKISYAASVAHEEPDVKDKYFFRQYLDSFKGISVREQGSVNALQECTKNKVNCHIDPVFLTNADDWQKLENKPKCVGNKKYILECFLSGTNSEHEKTLTEIAAKYRLKRINIFNKVLSPSEFIYLIHNAEIVFTDSFHAIVFSIIFKKPFVHVKRLIEEDMTLRMKNLEDLFQTKFIEMSNLKGNVSDDLFNFNIQNSEEIISREKERSIDYFKDMFSDAKPENNLNDKDFFCTGCGVCKDICPVGAIDYIVNEEGFIQKKIDINKCTHCGACLNCCPAIQQREYLEKKDVFILNRKESMEDNSSTTGLFSKLAEKVLEENGVVFGAEYDKENNNFIKIKKKEDLYKIQGSKYYQFNITKIYKDLAQLLKDKKKVLVCGSPCQIAGLKQRFSGFKNLILIQFICHGVPSKQLFNETCLERFGEIPSEINFKYHKPAWDNYSVKYKFNSEEKIVKQEQDLYMRYFLSDIALNNCCYNCKFVGKKTGADIIIGDCWGINQINKKFYSKNGVSIAKINSEKGWELFNSATKEFNVTIVPDKKLQYCNSNLFNEFDRENAFAKKAEFYELKREGKITSLKDYIGDPKYNQATKKQRLTPKRIIKKIIKKLLKVFFNYP